MFTDTTEIVSLKGINKTYNNNITALKAVDLLISTQEIIGIIGANGSGKSTLLKIIAGKLKPEQGYTKVFQLDAVQQNEQLKNKVSYISQDKALDPEMSGKESLHFFSALYGLSGTNALQRINTLIDSFEMNEFITRRINTYSGGQIQRLHLAIGIIHEPQLLLLDEPTSALDPTGKAFLWDFIQTYQEKGNTIVVVSHELDDIQQYCPHVVMLDKGEIVANALPHTIIQTNSTPILHIKTIEKLKDINNLEEQLLKISSSINIQFKEKSARLVFNNNVGPLKPLLFHQTIQIFAREQTVTECRWDDSGLANAYFKLTGKNIVKPSNNKNKKGKRNLL
ncbi:MAG: ABC transporter ATP-binding protein [Methylococcales bacterium]|nr:ABC transporter ATP-binding protein [Methylococcales bacterium]